ncbi:glyoxalase [Gracilaria domingensis]|nr:glyoxalase [Gracilaria domingensis]
MTAPTAGISHVGLSVGTLSKTVQFFEALNFKQVGGVPEYPSVFVSDGSTILTIWQAKSAEPSPFDRTKNVGLHHLALKCPSLEALDEVYEKVKAMEGTSIEFAPKRMPDLPFTHFMCYEPCGIRIEFAYHPPKE